MFGRSGAPLVLALVITVGIGSSYVRPGGEQAYRVGNPVVLSRVMTHARQHHDGAG